MTSSADIRPDSEETPDSSSPAAPIQRRSVYEEVSGRVRDMIIEGELEPGARVPVQRLAQELDVSPTPLREALKVLAKEGLVELLPNRGARVVKLSEKTINQLFQVLGMLEALAGELACANMSDEDIRHVRVSHGAMVDRYRAKDLSGYFKLNQDIHRQIMDASENRILQEAYAGLAGRVHRARFMANLSEDRWQHAVKEHEMIIAALEARDGPKLAKILRAHLQNKCEVVKALMFATVS